MNYKKKIKLYTVLTVALVFFILIVFFYLYACNRVIRITSQNTQTELRQTANLFNGRVKIIETALDKIEPLVIEKYRLHKADAMRGIVEQIVRYNDGIIGSSIAMAPYEYPEKGEYYMLYAYKDLWKELVSKELGDSVNYDYLKMEWYFEPMQQGKNTWSQPYFDRGAGNILMCTFSKLLEIDGRKVGVITADMSLNGIAKMLEETDLTSTPGTCFVTSSDHTIIYHPSKAFLMSKTPLKAGPDELLFTEEVHSTGWIIGKIISKEQLLHPITEALYYMILVSIVIILVLYITLDRVTRNMSTQNLLAKDRKMLEDSLTNDIYMLSAPKSMGLNVIRNKVDIAKLLTHDRTACGNFYNYRYNNGRLDFILGTVPGAGPMAAMCMAIVNEIYEFMIDEELSPLDIVNKLNYRLCQHKKEDLQLSVLIGSIDIETFEIELCSAGSPAPIITGGVGHTVLSEVEVCEPLGKSISTSYMLSLINLMPDQHLIIYTKSLFDLHNAEGTRYDQSQIFRALSTVDKNEDAEYVLDKIKMNISTFTHGLKQESGYFIFDIHRLA